MPFRAILMLALAAVTIAQDPLRDALNLGHTRDQALYDSFSRGYALTVPATLDSAEIVTEFRRAVMIVRERENVGDYLMDTRNLSNALAPFAGLVTFIVQVRLNPMNTFRNAPAYDLYVSTGPATKPVAGKSIAREAIYPLGMPPGSGMLAVRVTASFPRADIESAAQPSIVFTDDHAEVLWQARIDLSRYR